MEKETNNTLVFLNVFINNKDPITSVYRKKTYTGLLTNFLSLISFSYKLDLIRTLIDRTYNINSTLLGFSKEVKKLSNIFKKNQLLEGITNPVLNKYLDALACPLLFLLILNHLMVSVPFTLSCHTLYCLLSRKASCAL